MHNGLFLVLLIRIFSFITNTSPKVLLVETQVENSNVRKAGEDYGSTFIRERCPGGIPCLACGYKTDCPTEYCINKKVNWFETKIRCEQETTTPTTTTTRITTTSTIKERFDRYVCLLEVSV